jgi:hypothetical protein
MASLAAEAQRSAASLYRMRTIPRSLATFREIVNARGNALRNLSYHEIEQLQDSPIEDLIVESRPATIATIVQRMPDTSLRVILQGFMSARLFAKLKHVALDGFYKYPDDTVGQMRDDEFYDFD